MRVAAAVAAGALAALSGCGDDGGQPPVGPGITREDAPTETRERPSQPRSERPGVRRARCPAAVAGCRAVTGRVVYVEAVDPDGDGDAHYVLAGGSITLPGISVVDVKPSLRPRRLPRPGDRVSAAGPVYRGSYGQRQIEAVVVHHER